MYTRYLFLWLFVVAAIEAQGQDPHFTLYQWVPTALNPATTGMLPGENDLQRLTVNYRSQWSQVLGENTYRTAFAAWDRRFCPEGVAGNFGIGLRLMSDHGGAQTLMRNYAHLSGSYFMDLGKGHILSIGGEVGGISHRIGSRNRRFDEQFDGRDFNPGIPGEDFDRDHFMMFDAGAGINYQKGFKFMELRLGGSVKHFSNGREYRFMDEPLPRTDDNILHSLFMGQAEALIYLDDKAGLRVHGLYLHQHRYLQAQAGLGMVFRVVSVGVAGRLSRNTTTDLHLAAIIGQVGFDISEQWSLGMAYDFGMASMANNTDFMGVFELSMIWLIEGKDKCILCDSFKYRHNQARRRKSGRKKR